MNAIVTNLLEAERKAQTLFDTAEARGYITAGQSEKSLNQELYKLADELFGIKKYWHKRIVRSGANTLLPYRENPPDLILQEDDILFFDFGPVFEDYEADFGRTYVLGNDPYKLKLKADVALAWEESRNWYMAQKQVTGADYFHYTKNLAGKYGWEWGGPIAGHLVGKFPHERLEGEDKRNYIHPDCQLDMRAHGIQGTERYWILEIHFIDRQRKIGGFYEQLLW